jgi:CHAD domain-containing protein
MAYRFEMTETVPANLRRVAIEQLDHAVAELTDGVTRDPVEAVHDARKAIKMERSLLRLGREAIGSKRRRRENARLRDAAGRLSGARDADVMVEALADLAERYAGQLPEATFGAIRARLEHDRDSLRTGLEISGVVDAAIAALRMTRGEIEGWRIRGGGFGVLEGGLERSYARGRAAMDRAARKGSVESLHDWRKRVKDLWYHLRLFESAAPLTLAGQVGEAHALSDLLGDDHDLAVLRSAVLGMGPDLAVDHAAVIALIDHRRGQLQQEAYFIGRRLYAEKPSAFVRRLGCYWSAARDEARAVAARDAAEAAAVVRQPHR